jgi:hypothetical protein
VKSDSLKTASAAALQPGLLVAFKKDERTELGLVLQPDGKKNWWIANQVGSQVCHAHCGTLAAAVQSIDTLLQALVCLSNLATHLSA